MSATAAAVPVAAEPCPECSTGHIIHVSDNPAAVRHVCSARCGWDA